MESYAVRTVERKESCFGENWKVVFPSFSPLSEKGKGWEVYNLKFYISYHIYQKCRQSGLEAEYSGSKSCLCIKITWELIKIIDSWDSSLPCHPGDFNSTSQNEAKASMHLTSVLQWFWSSGSTGQYLSTISLHGSPSLTQCYLQITITVLYYHFVRKSFLAYPKWGKLPYHSPVYQSGQAWLCFGNKQLHIFISFKQQKLFFTHINFS